MADKPQLIVLNEGVFRPAVLVDWRESQYIGFDFTGHTRLEDEVINPSDIQLVTSAQLRPRTVHDKIGFKEHRTLPREDYEQKMGFRFDVVQGIFSDAQSLAEKSGVPYFSVVTDFGNPIKTDLVEIMKSIDRPKIFMKLEGFTTSPSGYTLSKTRRPKSQFDNELIPYVSTIMTGKPTKTTTIIVPTVNLFTNAPGDRDFGYGS